VRGVAAGARAARRGLRASDALRPLEARRTVAGTPRRYAPPLPRPPGHLRPNASYAATRGSAFDALLRAYRSIDKPVSVPKAGRYIAGTAPVPRPRGRAVV